MAGYHLAQFNLARALAPLDHPVMAGFMTRLDEYNRLAEASPGFVWRLKGSGGTSAELRIASDPNLLINLTLWQTADDLFAYTYRSDHKTVFARRFEWFERMAPPTIVLWWQPVGAIPTVEDGFVRLERLRDLGATAHAFSFKQRFEAPDQDERQPETDRAGRPGSLTRRRSGVPTSRRPRGQAGGR